MKKAIENERKLSPLMEQYWSVKNAHPDKILFFRMGDFFEIFDQDAIIAAPILGIALTVRNKKSGDTTKMCGMPHHSVAGPINKLLNAGFKVAICDQLEDAKLTKTLVKRGVTRILSPGMVFDPEVLDSQTSNYIACLTEDSLAFVEVSAGEAFYYLSKNFEEKLQLLELLGATELVLSEANKLKLLEKKKTVGGPHLSSFASEPERLKSLSQKPNFQEAWSQLPSAATLALEYIVYMQDESVFSILRKFERKELRKFLEIGVLGAKHLEIFENSRGEKIGSLYTAIHRCKSSIGSRRLKSWLNFPLQSLEEILLRQERVAYWIEKHNISSEASLTELRSLLAELGDPERRLSKLAGPAASPRDMRSLMESLAAGLHICYLAKDQDYDLEVIKEIDAMIRQIDQTIVEEAPVSLSKGSYINSGVNETLDEYIRLSTDGQSLLRDLEQRERDSYQIPSLKIRYNNVFGFYIDITNTHKDKVPNHYLRKQTLANSERYTTDELQDLERKILSSKSKREDLELEIFQDLKNKIVSSSSKILKMVDLWAEIDVLSSFAFLALERNYVKPSFNRENRIELVASKHPVIEIDLGANFVPNDIRMEAGECFLITGPNMAGKSTIMRQVALVAILAQLGCYVPARKADLPIFDKIFTRIGASDYLAEGHSTFMVEMIEASEILHSATNNSLIILDEIGRGTSTYDGLSLAQAILEHLVEKVGASCFFATHYHELSSLSQDFSKVKNWHMGISDGSKGIEFLHLFRTGPANRSYGIHVAKLAGMPNSVVRRAEKVLKELELSNAGQLSLLGFSTQNSFDYEAEPTKSLELVDSPLLEEIKKIKIQEMTPLDAMNRIAEWQKTYS